MKKLLLLTGSVFIFIFNTKATVHTITAQDFSFSPSSFTINLGDTVKWVWSAGFHTTTSVTVPAGAASWNQSLNSSSTSFTYIPAVAGTYNYQCNFHFSMGMIGSFTVNANCPPVTVSISANSAVTFCKGGSVLLTSSITGNVNSYQWYKTNTAISGQTNSSFTADVTGDYTVRVSSSCGSKDTSNIISVKVNPLPKATFAPSDDTTLCKPQTLTLTANNGMNLTYQWLKNNAPINNATNKTFTVKSGGTYKVMETNTATGCTKNSSSIKITVVTCFEKPVSTLSAKISDAVKIYPNPVAENFTLSISSEQCKGILEISIYNAFGKKVKYISTDKTGNYFERNIDMNDFAAGLYFVQISNGKIEMTQKFIKQ